MVMQIDSPGIAVARTLSGGNFASDRTTDSSPRERKDSDVKMLVPLSSRSLLRPENRRDPINFARKVIF